MYHLVLLLLVVATTIAPAGEDPWAGAAVKPGVKISVMEANGRTHGGRLLEWAAESVVLQTQSGRVEIARKQVALIRAPGRLGNLQTVFAPWENLAQVPSGHAVRVVRATGLPVDGDVFGIREDGVQLARGRKIDFIPRDEIRKVRIRIKGKTDVGAKVGSTTGFVVALLVIMSAATSSEGPGSGVEEFLERNAVGGGKVGESFDRLFDDYQTIYVSPRR